MTKKAGHTRAGDILGEEESDGIVQGCSNHLGAEDGTGRAANHNLKKMNKCFSQRRAGHTMCCPGRGDGAVTAAEEVEEAAEEEGAGLGAGPYWAATRAGRAARRTNFMAGGC